MEKINHNFIQSNIDPFIEIGNLIKEARIERNLSTEDLSNISRIPLTTILAIENNVKDLIPKYPFIRSILIKLEECLSLKKFLLINILLKYKKPISKKKKAKFIFNKFEILNSWKGGVLYLLILLISIFLLNNFYLNKRIIEFKYIEKSS